MFPEHRRQFFYINFFCHLLALYSCTLAAKAFNANYQEGFPSSDSDSCSVPRLCYSCASLQFGGRNWDIYKMYFRPPANFSIYCDPKMSPRRVPLVECKSPCTTVIEPVFLMGRKVRDIYFRGCFDKIFKSRDTEDIAMEYLMHSGDNCRTIPRNILYKQSKIPGDNITICSCVCDKCNVYPERFSGSSKLVSGYTFSSILFTYLPSLFLHFFIFRMND